MAEGLDELLGIQIAGWLARGDRLHGGRARGLAHHRRGRLHADRAADAHVARIAASGDPQVPPAAGHENAVGNAVTLARLQPAESA